MKKSYIFLLLLVTVFSSSCCYLLRCGPKKTNCNVVPQTITLNKPTIKSCHATAFLLESRYDTTSIWLSFNLDLFVLPQEEFIVPCNNKQVSLSFRNTIITASNIHLYVYEEENGWLKISYSMSFNIGSLSTLQNGELKNEKFGVSFNDIKLENYSKPKGYMGNDEPLNFNFEISPLPKNTKRH
ncbi:MAG: hypothetical protein KA783_09040 [Chitinophagales bacterium]|jgi:hypothetical protein|nr:hypothetical protein [Sphingobacteriales bacterium]MBP6663835.1 hypothetical protein [Chitinophagales bacterium]MBP7534583.1 hypothetical protein [Chitinophagales bacterium]